MYKGAGYETAKKLAKKFYKKIGYVLCPALNNEYINFNSVGFGHLIRKIKLRSRNEQKKRFTLLKYAGKIIKNPKAVIFYKQEQRNVKVKRYGKSTFKTSLVQYWTFQEYIKNWKIKVVIRQINKGQKHFYSIMGDKYKKPLN